MASVLDAFAQSPAPLVAGFLTALVASILLGAVMRRVSTSIGAVVPPRPDRWHSQPTPSMGGVAKKRMFGQRLYRPARHCRQDMSGTPGSTETRWPTASSLTPAPTSATSPAASWPSTSGASTTKLPMRPWS